MQFNRNITATGTYSLGDAMPGSVARWVVTLTDEGSLGSISIVPKGTATGSGETKTNAPYTTQVAPDTWIDPGSTPITAVGTYIIEASGQEIDLVIGTLSAGTLGVKANGIRG